MNTNTFAPIALSANNIPVFTHPAGHPHRPELLAETISKLNLSGTFCRQTVNLGRVIGKDHLVETTAEDTIVYLRRGNRPGETRMVIKEAADTSFVTIILCVASKDEETPDELVGKWVVVTLFEGQPGEREPWDKAFDNADIDEGVAAAKEKAEAFWATHALVPTDAELEEIMAGKAIGLFILKEEWEEQNEFADPDKANNGGGYSQPSIKLEFSDGVVVYIDDTSCGDFGSRLSALFEKGVDNWVANWGTMEERYESEIPENLFADHIRLIEERYGYRIPSKEDVIAFEDLTCWDENDTRRWEDSDWE